MQKFTYIITDSLGIHARPAGLLVKEAAKFGSEIKIAKGEKSSDVRRLFSVMGLGVKQGEEVTVTCSGEDEVKALAAMNKFFEDNL